MRRVLRVVGVAALLGPMSLLGACTGQSGSPTGVASASVTPSAPENPAAVSPSPSATATLLDGAPVVSSGMKLAGVPVVGEGGYAWKYPIAADGSGMVWFLGPWQLIRLDPATGVVTTWDAEGDRRFAMAEGRLAAATGKGVWLLDGGRVRLFDGERFVVDEQLPEDMLNVPSGPPTDGFAYDLVQAGKDLWVSVVDSMDSEEGGPDPSSGSQVVRFADDEWKVMSRPGDLVGGYLTVDSEGAVWDGGQVWSDDVGSIDMASGVTVKRWTGSAWTSPGGATAPEQGGEVVADPTGGVWLLASGAQGADRLRYFDGATWRSNPHLVQASSGDEWEPGGRGLAVDQHGGAWLLGARVSHSGEVQRLDGTWFNAVAAAGDRVVALDFEQVLLWGGDRFVPVTQRSGTADWSYEERPLVYAASADEVWVNAQDTWYRLRDGEWRGSGAGSSCLARATDGALWTTALDGSIEYPGGGQLMRTTADGSRAITDRPVLCGYGASTFAGPRGSVWVIQDDDVVQVRPDGRRTSIGRPDKVDRVCLRGVDATGAVWITEYVDVDDEECTAGTWHRWDGQEWQAAAEPDPFTSARENVVSGDGISWATRDAKTGTQITRSSATGRTRVIAEEPGVASLTAAPGSGACALAYPTGDSIVATAIVCFDARGETARIDVTGMGVEDFSVAPDGAIWVVGPQVARLARVAALS